MPIHRVMLAAWFAFCLAGGTAQAAPAKPQPKPSAPATRPPVPRPKPSAPAAKPVTPRVRPSTKTPSPALENAPIVPAAMIPEAVRRFRIGVFAGTNQLMPMASLSLGYRLPVADDRLEVLLEVGSGGAVQVQASGLGLQYQLADWGPWHPFVGMIGGVTYGLLPPWNGGVALVAPAPLLLGKVGMEWMAAPWFGLELALSGGYPNFFWRSQLGAKVAF